MIHLYLIINNNFVFKIIFIYIINIMMNTNGNIKLDSLTTFNKTYINKKYIELNANLNILADTININPSKINIEGLNQGDWVLIDSGDIIIHLFRPEVREFYNLEKMWQINSIQDTKIENLEI